ncbi:6,7-dimethyl-8-ribityllumazine synthase [Pseudolysinimonas kribbensis]|uniref:6,7-dimethyl-8-ribityllumazine synthase n=1 Tax=Pseudolysinimonas kribbensis TaxID=433641 RepID=A0ABQ6K1K5_9MICO|nr:6,7-dimethyl-8-ribityllumazine synthase [Pseudolysinimonas kribbensis]GMA94343.1 6,7-dimethyl-8-ribityllumazine synthase [Pseudolysinimonas kribbensis]
MSGEGRPELEPLDGSGLRIVIVSGLWHNTIADGLLQGARRVLAASGADVTEVPVPGSFELPVVAKAALDAGADAVVALGVIVRGETPHFDFVASAATDGLTRVALDTGKPVGFGVLTVDTERQGLDRAGLPDSKEDVGGRAAEAAITTVLGIRKLQRSLG